MLTPSRAGFAVSLFLASVAAVAPVRPAATGEPFKLLITPSTPTSQPADLKVGDWVRPVSGGPTMRIRAINGDTAICDFSDVQGTRTDEFPIAQLIFVAGRGRTAPPLLEPRRYLPCPANVIMSNGRQACLG